eukprot:scaffold19386_cov136-Isochrysis_galbana.AAC.2
MFYHHAQYRGVGAGVQVAAGMRHRHAICRGWRAAQACLGLGGAAGGGGRDFEALGTAGRAVAGRLKNGSRAPTPRMEALGCRWERGSWYAAWCVRAGGRLVRDGHLVANGTTVGQPAPLPTAIFPCAGEMATAAMVP